MSEPTPTTKQGSGELKRVQRAARKYEAARTQLEDAMQAANAAGHALRPIAAAGGFSIEWTRRLIRKAEERQP